MDRVDHGRSVDYWGGVDREGVINHGIERAHVGETVDHGRDEVDNDGDGRK